MYKAPKTGKGIFLYRSFSFDVCRYLRKANPLKVGTVSRQVRTLARRKGETMICMRCNSEEFKRNENALVEQEFRGELFKLKAPVMECTKCGWQALADDMADELLKRTGDAYRQRHGLLTSTEIINRFRLL